MTAMTEPIGLAEGRPFTVHDLDTKKAHYERLGVASYWLLNPVQPGGLDVHELDEQGQYRLAAKVTGDEVFAAQHPFPVEVCPARLLDGLRPHG